MAAITATVTAINKMVRGSMEAVLLNAIVGQPTLKSLQHLVHQLAAFASHFATTEWGGKHGFLPLVLTKTKMRLAARIQDLKCGHIKWPELLSPRIEDDTKGCELLQVQEDHKVHWQEKIFQEAIDAVAVKAIVAAIDAQYMEQLEEDCVGYKDQNIQTMFEQLQKWYVITTKGNLAIKTHFLETLSNTPGNHITTFSCQLYMHQVKCEDHGVTVT